MKRIVWHSMSMAAILVFCLAAQGPQSGKTPQQQRESAQKEYKNRNYKDAGAVFRELALNPKNDKDKAGEDLVQAVLCLQQLGLEHEADALRERAVEVHSDNWRLLQAAAESCFNSTHYGFIIAGEFRRGPHRGGGKYVNSFERDRVRAMQLMEAALEKAKDEKDKRAAARLHLSFARMLMGYRGYAEAWRLQYATDLSALPDYEEGYRYSSRGENAGAPIDEKGNPVFHSIPRSYRAAATDGERWRWMLIQAMELAPELTNEVLLDFANFLRQQFGVQTMAQWAWRMRANEDDDRKDESGTYALHTLSETETIAQLATGIKRFSLPDEFNFIRIYRKIADGSKTAHGETAINALAKIFEDRRQYDKAADCWKQSIAKHGAGNNNWKKERIDQILGNWGRFEPSKTHPAGKGAAVEYRFRNGAKVSFEARAIDVKALLSDVKAYLKSNPGRLDWERMNIENIGYRLVSGKADRYLLEKTAAWDLALEPRKLHFDRRITVATPLQKPGAYFLTARMENGNTSHVIVWVDDTVIVKKPLDKAVYYYVADAGSGAPVAKANIEFFGYKQTHVRGTVYQIESRNFAESTDADGQVILNEGKIPSDNRWLVTATTPDGRLAYLGFSGIWFGRQYDQEYNATRVYVITDRPVYRPNQPVKFKFWVRRAQYDREDASDFAKQEFKVVVFNPKRDKAFEKTFKTDEYGGLDGEFELPRDAMLGQYYAQLTRLLI